MERKRLTVSMPVGDWIETGLDSSGILLILLEPAIAVLSTHLPGAFHKDPADQIIVATSLFLDLPLATLDEKIRGYPGLKLAWAR